VGVRCSRAPEETQSGPKRHVAKPLRRDRLLKAMAKGKVRPKLSSLPLKKKKSFALQKHPALHENREWNYTAEWRQNRANHAPTNTGHSGQWTQTQLLGPLRAPRPAPPHAYRVPFLALGGAVLACVAAKVAVEDGAPAEGPHGVQAVRRARLTGAANAKTAQERKKEQKKNDAQEKLVTLKCQYHIRCGRERGVRPCVLFPRSRLLHIHTSSVG